MILTVGPYRVTVRAMARGRGSDDGASGMFLPWTSAIEVSADQAPCRQAEVLLHEVMHAVWSAQALPDKADEETVVTSLAKGLTQVMRDNPHLVEAITLASRDGVPIFHG